MFTKTALSCILASTTLISLSNSDSNGISTSQSSNNIVFITLDDVGMSDISGFGSEWLTPNLDKFLYDRSTVSMSSHYNGYSDSASRSQILTGLYSYHTGYGKIDSSFSGTSIGGIPQSIPTIAQYFKSLGNYNTYYIGTWGIGHSILEHTPTHNGFDYFYGSYGLNTDVLTKTQKINVQYTDPSIISSDNTQYYDLWENDQLVSKDIINNNIDSNTLYTNKLEELIATLQNSKDFTDDVSIITKNNNNNMMMKKADSLNEKRPFLTFLSLQGAEQYSSSDYKYNEDIIEECNSLNLINSNRINTCKFMLHLDNQFGRILDLLEDVWDNTLLIVTSDNGGSLTSGSCNYPLRGGKGSYFEGSTRSLALIGGGGLSLISSKSNQINTRNGLMSNVDWIPTLLSLTNLINSDWTKLYNLDGYNMDSYITGKSNNNNGIRDHIVLDLEMFGTEIYGEDEYYDNRGWAWSSDDLNDNTKQFMTLNGLAIVFYNQEGHLIKYYVSNRDDEITDKDIELEFNWCIRDDDSSTTTEITGLTTGKLRPFSGLYDLTNDPSEQVNLLSTINQNDFDKIKKIIMEKTDYYINNKYNEMSKYLYDSFDCFYKSYNLLAYPVHSVDNTLTQFFNSVDEWKQTVSSECGLQKYHPVLEFHTNELPDIEIKDNSAVTTMLNSRVPNRQNSNTMIELTKENVDKHVGLIENNNNDIKVVDENHVYSSCVGLDDGRYYVQINFDTTKPILNIMCSNGYMLIDYSTDNDWKEYFSSWTQFHWQVASPFKSDYADMTTWFLPDASSTSNYDYILSFDCDSCLSNSLYQTEGLSTTYWQSTVPNFCGDADKGVNGADEMWDYQCRTAVFSTGYQSQELLDIWHMTDENGIDRDVLLTQLSATGISSHVGICSSLKKSKDYDNFNTQLECATGSGGELPVIGLQSKYCVCAREELSKFTSTAQKREITSAELSKVNSDDKDDNTIVYGGKNGKNADSNRIVYMNQDDFKSGTYRITKSGTYKLLEDIIFDYNAPDYINNPDYSANQFDEKTGDMHWYPKQSQKELYPGAYDYRNPYHLGFFAGITIEVDDVIIDLNGYTIKMDERYFFQQPFWSHIQLGNSNFIPGKGPSPLIIDPIFVSNIVIKNGILGLTSHHCIHGTSPKHSFMSNIRIENIECRDFTTHGIQLNGFNGLIIENVEVGPTTTKHLLTSDYSNMRTLLPRFRYFADLYGNTQTFKFGGKPSVEYLKLNNIPLEQVSLNNYDEYTLSDILDEAIEQMDMAYDYVTGRKTEDELNNEYGLQWLQAKRVFVYESQNGIPYGGSLYGVYLNYPGTGITGFYTNHEVSKNVIINNLHIHDLTHGTVETPCITDQFKSIFGVAVSAQKLLGDNNFYNYYNLNNIKLNNEMYYYGTIVYDMFLAFYDMVNKDSLNIDVLNLGAITESELNWVKKGGNYQREVDWSLTCGNDPMFHAVKGMYGLRMSGIQSAKVTNVVVENMKEISKIGSDMCGTFVVFSQQQPYMYGYSGNNIHSVSVLHTNVLFNNININNIESYTGNSTAISIYPRSNVKFEGNNNNINNIIAGKEFIENNINYEKLYYDLGTWPNPMPRGCAIKADNFGDLQGLVNVNSLGNFDGTKINVNCVGGYLDCNENVMMSKNKIINNKEKTLTDFGIVNSDNQCNYQSVNSNDNDNDMKDVVVDKYGKNNSISLLGKYGIVISGCIVGFALIGLLSMCYYKVTGCAKERAVWQGYQTIKN